jgi:predicted Zn-dependent protease
MEITLELYLFLIIDVLQNMREKSILIFAIMLLIGCATVPITGRRQLSLISNDEIIPLSFQNYEKVLAEGNLSENKDDTEMIKRVGARIERAVKTYMNENGNANQLTGFEWDFNLIENDTVVNAWCMPGGKVAFYSGILPICEDELGVAVVMGHEIAHAIANHSRERMSQQMAVNGMLSIGSAAAGSGAVNDIFLQSVGMGSQIGLLKFSRNNESEADHMGLIFMAIAGYNPSEAPEFWQRMSELSGGSESAEWLSTHPSHERRITDLKAWQVEAEKYYAKSQKVDN